MRYTHALSTHTHIDYAYHMHIVMIIYNISGEVHIGGANFQKCVPFFCGLTPITERKCCYFSVSQHKYFRSLPLMGLSVYGDAPINLSLTVEWITSSTDHYPTDLGPYIDRNSTNPIGWVS